MAAAEAELVKLRLKFPGAPSLMFKDFSIRIEKGEKVLLLGPSGCGKSTLLQVLTGIIPQFIEVPLKAERTALPESWGCVFQDPDTQFCMPYVDEEMAFVLENLQVPRERMARMMRGLLEQVGLRFGDLHTPIQSLSQGMKQRLAIASVLALEPEALFLDEPTALLDPEGTTLMWKTLKEVAGSRTVVIVEHKIDEVIDFVDRVLLFGHDGQLLADGSPELIFSHHKQELQSFGIWYPGVWGDYVSSDRYSRRNEHHDYGDAGACADQTQQPLLKLERFTGFQGKEAKLAVDSVEVYRKEWIAIVGENGAGKSTLLQSLMQLIRTEGGYALDDQPVTRFADINGKLTYVFQNPEFQFVTNSVYEEIALTLRLQGSLSDNAVKELLEQFGLTGLEKKHPYQLSLGQKRRLSVAAALPQASEALLLDEPTFGQDARNTFALLERLERLRQQGTTLIMVTHDPEIVAHFATRVWVVSKGELTADLKPAPYLNSLKVSHSESRGEGVGARDEALCP
jgi:energy-coupling factor transporter ATP-binding protein EcfA2